MVTKEYLEDNTKRKRKWINKVTVTCDGCERTVTNLDLNLPAWKVPQRLKAEGWSIRLYIGKAQRAYCPNCQGKNGVCQVKCSRCGTVVTTDQLSASHPYMSLHWFGMALRKMGWIYGHKFTCPNCIEPTQKYQEWRQQDARRHGKLTLSIEGTDIALPVERGKKIYLEVFNEDGERVSRRWINLGEYGGINFQ